MRYRTLTVAAALTAASLSGVSPAAAAEATSTVTIGLNPGTTAAEAVQALDDAPGVRVLDSEPATELGAVTVTVTGDAAGALAGDPGVAYVEKTPVARIMLTPNDPLQSQQWGNRLVKAPAAWEVTTGSADVTVAVLDTGVNPVSELAGRVLPGYDFVNDDADPSDDHGHGTAAASVVAAAGDNGSGFSGLCWTCRILPVKVMNGSGEGGHDDIAQGIVYAVDHGADVINMSLGGPAGSQILADAVAYAAAHGVLVIASAGNDGVSTPNYPAAYPSAVAVAGSTETDARYSWSNHGAWVDVAAPGTNAAQSKDGSYVWFSGTSSAGPVVAGVAALVRSANPQATAAQVRAAIESTADPAGSYVATGRVDADGAVRAVKVTDVTAPTIAWSSPAVSGTPRRGRITVTATAADTSGVATVELLRAGKVIGADTAAPWSLSFDSAGLNGTQTLTLRATDRAGNTRTANRALLVDNAAPTIATIKSTVVRKRNVTIAPAVRDNLGVQQVKAVVTNGAKKVTLTSTTSPWTLKWTAPRAATYPVTVTVTDRAGNTRTLTTKVKSPR
ncbi:S8 family serine peptidase [Actinoplanes utahensis]|uniref:S8 family serine peptidase n=1 Tax=Actinoplanes utahensis TaxID=1869 RepID=UPI00068ACB0E|nr:S8 family serine peptidase [Actinoplanes utahensis]GIF30687.1 hypothetical protein Aut01nite_36730 [Actinoplanes utahensis]